MSVILYMFPTDNSAFPLLVLLDLGFLYFYYSMNAICMCEFTCGR